MAIKERWTESSRTRKTLVVLAVVLSALLLIELAVYASVWTQSVQHGLTIHVEPERAQTTIAQGETFALAFDLGVQNPPFCRAVCDWRLIDGRTEETLGNGTITAEVSSQTIAAPISAPTAGEHSVLYQFRVTCQNRDTYRCQRSGERRTAVASTLVNVRLTEDKEEERERYLAGRGAWTEAAGALLAQLERLTALSDIRLPSIPEQARTDHETLRLRAAAVSAHVDDEEFAAANALLSEPLPTGARDRYLQARQTDIDARSAHATLQDRRADAAALAAILDPQRLIDAYGRADAVSEAYPRLVLTESSRLLQNASATLQSELARAPEAIGTVENGTRLLHTELLAACRIKDQACPPAPAPVPDLRAAAARLNQTCAALERLDESLSAAHAALANDLIPNGTVEQAEQAHNVSALRQSPGWEARERQILSQARAGNVSLTVRERLAVRLSPANETIAYARRCPAQVPDLTLTALPEALEELNVTGAPVALADPAPPQCCASGVCAACPADSGRYPVVLVHGHSFSENSAPEFSVQALSSMGEALSEDGYVYIGRVFPGASMQWDLRALPVGVAASTTYYYNSYAEEGSVLFVTQKSENLETYAIRLNEAITEVKRTTGSDKVVIVAHSMGGLVARERLRIFGASDVAGLVMVGTPNQGIRARTERLCPVVGGDRECQDMRTGSVFLRKLNAGPRPDVPMLTIGGIGCEGRDYDGVVEEESVRIAGVEHITIEGSCPSTADLLHSSLIKPAEQPDAYDAVVDFLDAYGRR